jgi:predicted acylesterase/phospholipase RssA
MADEISKALVVQGGGALGAFALGAARVLYHEADFRPDIVSGVSIGAITAVLLARPRDGDAIATLERFWETVTVSEPWWPQAWQRYAAVFGNPHFFTPRTDLWAAGSWTSFYSTEPLKRTLEGLVDLEALADPAARPRLLMTATDVEAGVIRAFDSADGGLTLDHVLASGSLPPSFPMTEIGGRAYWDGGLFDNTPLSEVLARLSRDDDAVDDREVVVINLFPNAGERPADLHEVSLRALNLMFANKTESDLRLLDRFNGVAALLQRIREDPALAGLAAEDVFLKADRNYVRVPEVKEITRKGATADGAWTDFSPAGIKALVDAGEAAARAELASPRMQGGELRAAP